jgi:hypothetical protein
MAASHRLKGVKCRWADARALLAKAERIVEWVDHDGESDLERGGCCISATRPLIEHRDLLIERPDMGLRRLRRLVWQCDAEPC